jgi:hypothetical protein
VVLTGPTRPPVWTATPQQFIHFRWSGSASAYGAHVVGYRYGWDILDLSDDTQWEQGWGLEVRQSSPRQFPSGLHRFHVEARDDAGLTTHGEIEVEIHPMPRSRDLLLVNDTTHWNSQEEALEDAQWLAVMDSLTVRHPFQFGPGRDVWDVFNTYHGEPPPLEVLFDYKTVVWTLFPGQGVSAIRDLAFFMDPFASRPLFQPLSSSYLKTYLDNGGQMWVSGFRPANHVWPVDQMPIPQERKLPVNVTNWDDPITSHAPFDSVGTISWLYKMGVEAFDVGSGTLALSRCCVDQNCNGLRSAVPGAPVLEVDAARWDQPAGHGRPNIEIYNMPSFMASQHPPLLGTLSLALYTYVSRSPEDPARSFTYPKTADHQPALVLRKRSIQDTHYSRAICGFEPYLLTFRSHLDLADYILVHEMGLGQPGRH